MEKTKLIVVALIVSLVVAGSAVILMKGSDDEKTEVDGKLLIYGNADGDDVLDERDIDKLNDIISGATETTEFADANQDGNVDSKDIDLVRDLIAGRNCIAYYYDALNNCSESFEYPLKSVFPTEINSLLATKILGMEDKIIAIYGDTMDSTLFADVLSSGAKNLGKSPTVERVSEIAEDLGAMITLTSARSVTNEAALEATGEIRVIRLGFDQADNSSAYLTYGFMLGASERANKFVQFTEDLLKEISEKVNTQMTDDEKKKGLVLGYNVLYGKQQNYGTIITNAGGKDVVDWDAYRLCNDGYEWLYAYDFDFIVGLANPAGYDYKAVSTADDDCISIWDRHYDRYKDTDAVKNGGLFVLDNNMPLIIKTAYVAEKFYPEIFGEGFGDSIHQKYVDMFIDNLSGKFDVKEDGVFVLTSDFIATLKA